MMVPVGRLVILRTIPRSEFVGALAWLTMPALSDLCWDRRLAVSLPPISIGDGSFGSICRSPLLAWCWPPCSFPNVRGETISRFDYLGFVLSGIGLAGLVSASAALDAAGVPLWVVGALFLVGSVSVVLYVFHARRAESPILDLRLLRYPTFRAGIVGGSLFRIGVGAMPLLLPLQLQLGFGMTPLNSGLLTFVAAVGAIGMKTAAGTILKRFGFRTVLMSNAIVSSAMIAAPALFWATTPISYYAGCSLCRWFFPVTCSLPASTPLAFAEIDQPEMSQATSFTSAFQQIALSLGITVGASMLQLSLAIRHSQTLAAPDFPAAFLVVGIIAAISFVSFASFRRMRAKKLPDGNGWPRRLLRSPTDGAEEKRLTPFFRCQKYGWQSRSRPHDARKLRARKLPTASAQELAYWQ